MPAPHSRAVFLAAIAALAAPAVNVFCQGGTSEFWTPKTKTVFGFFISFF